LFDLQHQTRDDEPVNLAMLTDEINSESSPCKYTLLNNN